MKQATYLAALILAACATRGLAAGDPSILYDFEENTDGWVVDWGLEQAPIQIKRNAANGHGALAIDHHFRKDRETIGMRVPLPEPRDFTSVPGFDGFSAWVYFPNANWWEAQVYVSMGDNWETSWGKLSQKLNPGWHKITIGKDELANPADVRAIGIQIKNFTVNTQSRIFVDYIQILGAGSERAGNDR
ncbi:MAG: hypothetical protein JXB04_10515 [Kiritimatiellae bacterium]|nr:hypothetical protein [Kiritimatiellia bacterium]